MWSSTKILSLIFKWDWNYISLQSESTIGQKYDGSSCGRADSIMDLHITGPGFKTWMVRYFLLSFQLATTIPVHKVERSLVCVEGQGRISWSGLSQEIKMGSCVFQCDVPHQCILWRGGVSCPVSAAWHSCVASHWSKYHCYKQASSWYDLRCLKATLNPNKLIRIFIRGNIPHRES